MKNYKSEFDTIIYFLPDLLLNLKTDRGLRRIRYKDVCFTFIDQDLFLRILRRRTNILLSPLQLNRYFLQNRKKILDKGILSYKIYRVISSDIRTFIYGIKYKGIDKNPGHVYSVLRELGIDIDNALDYETIKSMVRMKYDESFHSLRQALYLCFRC